MNILIVSSVFPPDNGIGTLRIMSFSKYLIKNGHNVVLVTKKKSGQCLKEYAHEYFEIDEIPSDNVGALGRYKIFCQNEYNYKKGFQKIIEQVKVDFTIITGGPFYTFSVASVANEYKIPCNLDFRDPWFFDVRGRKDLFSPSRNLARMAYFVKENKAVKNAAIITTVTTGWVEKFKRLYFNSREKFYLIENGYDDERVRDLKITYKEHEDDGKVHIAVFGKMFYYSTYFSKMFCNVLKTCSFEDRLKIHQIGEFDSLDEKIISLTDVNKDLFTSTGFKKYEEGIQELAKYDVFLIIDSRKNAMGTKLYDYIYLNKPILYIGPKKTAITSILAKLNNSYVCNNFSEIKNALNDICRKKMILTENDENSRPMKNKSFSRGVQNKKWLDIIENYI